MKNIGIDYGNGTTNIDRKTGIRYGVINQHNIGQTWYDESKPYYGEPSCPWCGEPANDDGEYSKTCPDCNRNYTEEEMWTPDPLSIYVDDGKYSAACNDSGDIFITKSPFYTTCEFCSPCAPGAGYIMNTVENGVRAYCFGHDWFENGEAPYPVFDVNTGKQV